MKTFRESPNTRNGGSDYGKINGQNSGIQPPTFDVPVAKPKKPDAMTPDERVAEFFQQLDSDLTDDAQWIVIYLQRNKLAAANVEHLNRVLLKISEARIAVALARNSAPVDLTGT